LKRIRDIKAVPELTTVTRWKTSMPQYHVGHQKAISNMRETFKQSNPGGYITGAALEDFGNHDFIDQ
ncbi:protoporphyrinogen oxidase, partial [Bacillus pumilus]